MAFYTDTRALRGASFAAGGKAATFGDYLGASAGDAWNDNPAAALYHSARLNHARYGLDQISDLVSQAESGGLAGLEDLPPLEVQNPLSLEEQKAQIRAEGLEGHAGKRLGKTFP